MLESSKENSYNRYMRGCLLFIDDIVMVIGTHGDNGDWSEFHSWAAEFEDPQWAWINATHREIDTVGGEP